MDVNVNWNREYPTDSQWNLDAQIENYNYVFETTFLNSMRACLIFLLLYRSVSGFGLRCSHLPEVITWFKWHIQKAFLSTRSGFRFLFTDPSFLIISLCSENPSCTYPQDQRTTLLSASRTSSTAVNGMWH